MPLRRILRGFSRRRGFSLTVLATLAASVAVLTLTFGVVDAALWRTPPFDGAGRIAILLTERLAPGRAPYAERWSYARIAMLRDDLRSFERIANFSRTTVNLTGDGDPEPVQGEIVSPEYFPMLHGALIRGRAFSAAEDDAAAAHPVAVIGFDLWRRRYAGDSRVIGRTVYVNGVPLTVIGVAGRGFRGLTDRAEIWIPTTMAPVLTYPAYLTTNQNFISVAARLRLGITLAQANAELATVGARIDARRPPDDRVAGEAVTAAAVTLNAARADAATRRSLLVLLGAVSLLHLLACANVVNLLLGRAAARRSEAALRVALGSTTARLVRHYGMEALTLAGMGGGLGAALAAAAARFMTLPASGWFARNFYGSIGTFDAPSAGIRTLAFSCAAAVGTALLAASASGLGLVALDLGAGLGMGARGSTGGWSLRRPSVRGAVVALEAALAVLLVVAAGLMIESFARMRHAEVGIRADHLLTFWVRPSEASVPPRDAPRYIARLLRAVEQVPGVVAASVDGGTPLGGSATSTLLVVGRPVPTNLDDAPPVDRHYVAPGHFRALGIPLVRGRAFTDADDADHPRVAIISETAARRFWPGEDPLGQRVWFGGGSSFDRPDSSATIVGIVGDVADEPLDARPNRASCYTPYLQFTYATRAVFVRTSGAPEGVVGALRKAVAAAAPGLPLSDVQTMEERIGGSWARQRFDAELFGVFGAAALLLAAVGTYAVVTYAVARRTRELGIRLALGARPGAVIRLVIREGMTFPALGLVAGVAGALALTRLMRASLYGVGPSDPRVFGATVLLLLGTSAAACAIPALRATRADPLEALRAE